ncbi:LysR substrate-binding domain-containing protein [Phyllobacterium myrsinacearum]|uniref:LysR family transcriptional regulator n=1 Tax=Phyllobacterium myrsinacearum TaxID=28101 RepID=A0A2S9JPT7_9HYPH|nr:LysR substrate-binding domain-containing protein [Phyllobacterium myrsinacearum]PRD55092.1 LysR family transcriptional regulator [Phyllobacterium myrsinacearum]PWV90345.1 DNA-binding transcriptional LysR family regulator [Phyllobacterium myrsinacearum]RZV05460.1 DNA-binding transcriptional LysR family regulator [Phyllobacterium myrsinacearum]
MARKIPSLTALRAFEAAGRHGRMTLAADELNVTHSAISRQVQHLEDVLGVPLFEGPKNALRLTDAGTRLLSGLVPAFDQIDLAVRLVADTEDGPLDVSCPGTFTMRWLIPRLYRFQAAHPDIDVRLTSSSKAVDFSRDGFDVAIRVGSGPWPEAADVIPLFSEQIGPVLASSLAPMASASFAGIALLHSKTRLHAWPDWCARSGIAIGHAPGREYEHFYFMLEAAMGGLGVCIAPWPFVADDIRAGRLVAPHRFIGSGQDYVALRRARRHRKSSLFCAWLAMEAQAFTAASEAVLLQR